MRVQCRYRLHLLFRYYNSYVNINTYCHLIYTEVFKAHKTIFARFYQYLCFGQTEYDLWK